MIPCKECIGLAMCKHRSFSDLMECDIIRAALYHKHEDKRLFMINRRDDFRETIAEIDKLFDRSYSCTLISRGRVLI